MENNSPVNPSASQLWIKLAIGLFIGFVFAALIFLMFVTLWSTIDEAVRNSVNNMAFSPLVWLSFLWIWLVSAIFWNIVLAIIYNVSWSEDYYDIKLMTSSILSANILLLIPFLLLYFFVWTILQDIKMLFITFAFHLFFSTYLSLTTIDLVKNPNYAPVYVIWNSVGFIVAVLIFFFVFFLSSTPAWEVQKNILFYTPILSFAIIPFFSTLFEKIYYKFYEMWNDFLYIPSISEVLVDEEEVDEVNVKL